MNTKRYIIGAILALQLLLLPSIALADVGEGGVSGKANELRSNQPISLDKTINAESKTSGDGASTAGIKKNEATNLGDSAEKKKPIAYEPTEFSDHKGKTIGGKGKKAKLVNATDDPDNSETDKTENTDTSWQLQTFFALFIVIILIYSLKIIYSKLTGRRVAKVDSKTVEVLSRVNVGMRSHVLLLKVGKRVLVVGEGTQGLNTLSEIDDDLEVASILGQVRANEKGSVSKGFQKMLGKFEDGYEEKDLVSDEGLDESEFEAGKTREDVNDTISRIRNFGRDK